MAMTREIYDAMAIVGSVIAMVGFGIILYYRFCKSYKLFRPSDEDEHNVACG